MVLHEFFQENKKAALAFSGGVDSAFLLYAALREGADICAYYVRSAFQPQFEFEDARRLAESLSAKLKILPVDVLCEKRIAENSPLRCYYCKKALFSAILQAADEDDCPVVIDGTNASDQAEDRPGMKALAELSVRSPLRECGLTKPEIRRLSREAGLFTWNKPAYACLATRIPTGTSIRMEDLIRTEKAEHALMKIGFQDFRVRMLGCAAKIEIPQSQFPLLIRTQKEVVYELKQYYSQVLLDLEARNE